ncbi:MAG TPA: glycosyltransferase family 2 protein [Aquaticitalea sp.]|nr:glycosyltransferase family 2 protein [Aquaticitalea sp.]
MVSVIVPNYNHARFLQQRLDSIFNQTYQDFEVIILDDCSTDNSLEILEPYKNHPKVSAFIVNEKNTGSPFKQWEKGLRLAKGSYIWIAESDDSCELDFIETQLQCLDNAHAEVSVAATRYFDDKNTIKGNCSHPIFKNDDLNHIYCGQDVLYCPVLNVSAIVFRANCVKNSAHYSSHKLIGDRVFYHEMFYHGLFVYNAKTTSYFRKVNTGVSDLGSKGIGYLNLYFIEHVRFANLMLKNETISKELYNAYIKRFYNRVKNRLNKKEKISLVFFKVYLLYIFSLRKVW